ncbi:MAG TPA: enoyl-CoA hydratase/isomerase family protein, partial [Acidimicrobiia bacterium]|nr:enoyl-CoA hydratase/isomerase family protein [Acidimicrobiia bacterium]
MGDLRVEVGDGIAVLTIDRPRANNSITGNLLRELLTAVAECDADDGVRAIVTTANVADGATAWCAGVDLRVLEALGPGANADDMFFDGMLEGDSAFLGISPRARPFATLGPGHWVLAWRRYDTPLIAAINGAAAGGGLGLALLHDYRVAGESARFKAAFATVGVAPDMGVTWLLPRLIGPAAATEMLLRDRPLDAAEARSVGLVHTVVPDGEVVKVAVEIAAGIAALPPLGVRAAVRALRAAPDQT